MCACHRRWPRRRALAFASADALHGATRRQPTTETEAAPNSAFRNLTPQTYSATAAAAGECDQTTAAAAPPQACSDATQHATNSLACDIRHPTCTMLQASMQCEWRLFRQRRLTLSTLKPTQRYNTHATVGPVTSWLLPRSSRRLRRPALRLRLRLRLRQAERPRMVRGKATQTSAGAHREMRRR